jgi:flagellar biosynthesis/type III secretory pathway chaperone
MNTKPHNYTFQDFIASLEELFVKQFRSLQSLRRITNRERVALSTGDANGLIPLTKEKESILEQIEIVEDSQHIVLEEIGKLLKIRKKVSLSEDILPRLDPDMAKRIIRLRNGIMILYDEARDLNRFNQALARDSLDR